MSWNWLPPIWSRINLLDPILFSLNLSLIIEKKQERHCWSFLIKFGMTLTQFYPCGKGPLSSLYYRRINQYTTLYLLAYYSTTSKRPTCVLTKLMERLFINKLGWHLETKNLLHPVQASFKKNWFIKEHVTTLLQSIEDNLDKDNIIDAVIFYLKGAYNTSKKQCS